MTGPIVSCEGVARTYGSGSTAVVAVHGIDCRVEPGARIAVVGPSGSGKSTLLHLLAGLEAPTAGTVSWPGLGHGRALRPGPVATVFQGPSLLPALDVADNVALPQLLSGSTHRDARRDALDALGRLGLADLAGALPEEISGGQAQRVAVARALVGDPMLLLADEPTGQLDAANARAVVDAVLAAARPEAAVVVCTHDAAVADRMQQRWPMADGRLTTGVAA